MKALKTGILILVGAGLLLIVWGLMVGSVAMAQGATGFTSTGVSGSASFPCALTALPR
jgi:hypothetical protein